MRERPILFSGPMVRAILEGRKTQTRRALQLDSSWRKLIVLGHHKNRFGALFGKQEPHVRLDQFVPCPYGQPGDRLWVREAWAVHPETGSLLYRADDIAPTPIDIHWKPSIHMPRKHSRIMLEITGIKVERVQDISWEDALAEGTDSDPATTNAVGSFAKYWNYINGAEAWDMNPWVWVVGFKKVEV